MKWAVDKIIDNIVLLENIETLEKKEVDISQLPSFLHEGAILVYSDNEYYLNETEEEKRRRLIEEKFRRLRDND
jgi:hypothetical protein